MTEVQTVFEQRRNGILLGWIGWQRLPQAGQHFPCGEKPIIQVGCPWIEGTKEVVEKDWSGFQNPEGCHPRDIHWPQVPIHFQSVYPWANFARHYHQAQDVPNGCVKMNNFFPFAVLKQLLWGGITSTTRRSTSVMRNATRIGPFTFRQLSTSALEMRWSLDSAGLRFSKDHVFWKFSALSGPCPRRWLSMFFKSFPSPRKSQHSGRNSRSFKKLCTTWESSPPFDHCEVQKAC